MVLLFSNSFDWNYYHNACWKRICASISHELELQEHFYAFCMIDIELVGLNMDSQKENSLDEINYDIFYKCINAIGIKKRVLVTKFLIEWET